MAHAHRPDDPLDQALARLARHGGPAPIRRDGKVVAVLLTPEELERLEDERDAAILREAIARGPTGDAISLEDLAADLGIDLEAVSKAHPPSSFDD